MLCVIDYLCVTIQTLQLMGLSINLFIDLYRMVYMHVLIICEKMRVTKINDGRSTYLLLTAFWY